MVGAPVASSRPATDGCGFGGLGYIAEVDDERSFSLSLPLDEDGFPRRECPSCERELKWLVSDEGETEVAAPPGGYFCPYCGIQADPGSWWTQEQLAHAQTIISTEMIEPELRKLQQQLKRTTPSRTA
jgi:hypothetical protein